MNSSTIQVPNTQPRSVQALADEGGGAISIADVAFILFRHKWKILTCGFIGLIAAGTVWITAKPKYVSVAKFMIRYVVESRDVGPLDQGDQLRSPDSGGANIIGSEIELLNSRDLAEEVANAVGVSNIITEFGKGDPVVVAARAIQKDLEVGVLPKSNVIEISFRHTDPETAKNVVTVLLNRYLRLHARVHRALDVLDDLARQSDQKRLLVETTEGELRRLKETLGITSLKDAQQGLSVLISSLRVELLQAEAQLAEVRATLKESHVPDSSALEITEVPVKRDEQVDPISPPSPGALQSYQAVLRRLEFLRSKEQELLIQFTPNSHFVRRVVDQIAEAQKEADALVATSPGLTNTPVTTVPVVGSVALQTKSVDPTIERARVAGLEAKVKALREQLEKARNEARTIADKEADITQLERKLEIGERQYSHFSTSLEKARIDEAVSTSRLPNISIVQEASPAFRALGKKAKLVAGLVAGGFALGIALACFLEFFADSSVRRPKQISDTIKLPLFISIPPLSERNVSLDPRPQVNTKLTSSTQGLSEYSEALRDRLIMHFQIRNLQHKPKLIGVTSCGKGAGVTTVATALAASLSQTGEGNVLYIDINPDESLSAHPFRQGKPAVAVQEALVAETQDSALVQENLYAVSLLGTQGPRFGVLPRTITDLVSKIKTSSYDYIIFDLPRISQTSVTPRVTGLLDITLMVLESEKTNLGLAAEASRLLSESHANVVAVLNKHRRYIPRTLDVDL